MTEVAAIPMQIKKREETQEWEKKKPFERERKIYYTHIYTTRQGERQINKIFTWLLLLYPSLLSAPVP